MQIVSGDEQTGVAGEELLAPLVVRVVDSAGRAVPQQIVNFRVTTGGGSVFAGAGLTNADGIAQERWTLGPNPADSQRVEARAVDNVTGAALTFAIFAATATAGSANTLTQLSGGDWAPVGAPVSLGVLVADRVGNHVAGAVVHWAASIGTVSPESSITDTSGSASSNWTLPLRLDITPTATARVGTLTPLSFAPVPILPVGGAVFALDSVLDQGQSAPVGTTLAESLTVSVTLADGRPVQGVPVNWSPGLGSSFHPASSLTSSAGVAKTSWTVGPAAGYYYGLATLSPDRNPLYLRAIATVQFTGGVTAGLYHTCGLASNGDVYCWGRNGYGQVGNVSPLGPSPDNQGITQPALVPGAPKLSKVSPGGYFTCGLTPAGAAYCWGRNTSGELGNGSIYQSNPTPAPVTGGLTFASITAGFYHACGLTSGGAAYCWGANNYGQLGHGDTVTSATPVPIQGGLTFRSLSAGYGYTCGIASDSTGYCWGQNYYGYLGNPTNYNVSPSTPNPAPLPVSGGLHFRQLTANVGLGNAHTCGIDSSGAAWCWGNDNYGQLGDGSVYTASATPVPVGGGLVFASISVGGHQTCGITNDGNGYCWGQAVGSNTPWTTPQPWGGSDVLTFSLGDAHGLLLTTGIVAYGWGSNQSGQVGGCGLPSSGLWRVCFQ